ncbi:MAG: DNA polymerase III subunit [Clostridia bacterium]|nr:DNA polymerase III subunit [Clostridia bacterium]
MAFSDMRGGALLAARFSRLLDSGNIPQSMIFEGRREPVLECADSFARAILCDDRRGADACGVCSTCMRIARGNAEEIAYFGEKDLTARIKVEDVRRMGEMAMVRPFSGKPQIMIVRNAERMWPAAQSALLKLIEEPPEGLHIILTTANSQSLLQTIRSRCQLVRVQDVSLRALCSEDPAEHERAVRLMTAVAEKRHYFEMKDDIDQIAKNKNAALNFVNEAEIFARDMMVSCWEGSGSMLEDREDADRIVNLAGRRGPGTAEKMIEAAELARRDINSGVSAAHALKYMIFDILEWLDRPAEGQRR